MVNKHESSDKDTDAKKKRPALHRAYVIILFLTITAVLCVAFALVNNNVSLASDEAFASQLDTAIEN